MSNLLRILGGKSPRKSPALSIRVFRVQRVRVRSYAGLSVRIGKIRLPNV